MKKIFTMFGMFLVFGGAVFAQMDLPDIQFSVVNVSQGNKDAEQVGARVGDVLRYELTVGSQMDNVDNFVPTVNIADVLRATEIIDTGVGEITAGQNLVYPVLTEGAPFERIYTFFARVKPNCGNIERLRVSAYNQSTTVNLLCGLPQSGPSSNMVMFFTIMMLGVCFMAFRNYRVE